MARKYLIETFGCQMNVHDSERMAGLLEQAGFEATDDAADADVVVINTCSVRERAEEKLYTRLGELRAAGRRAGPRPDRRGRRLRGAAGRRGAPQALAGRRRRHRRHAGDPAAADARRAGGRRRGVGRLIDLDPYDDVTFPLGVTRRGDPVKAYVTIIEGCNEFCSFCVVPYTRGHERMRPKADILAEVREAAASGPARGAAARADRQPLPGARRPGVRLRGPARGVHEVAGHRAHPVRQPASAPRLAAVPRRRCAAAEGLPAPAPAGAVGLDARARRRCAGATRARATSTWSARIRDATAGRRALDRYDRRVSRRDRRRLRGDAVADRARCGYHSMFSFKYSPRPNTLADKRLADDVQRGGEDAADRGAAGAAAGDSDGAQRGAGRRGRSRCWSTRPAGARDTELSGRTSQNVVVNLPGPAEWIGRDRCAVRVERAGPHSVWGRSRRGVTATVAEPRL